MTNFVDFAERLVWFRAEAGMTQRELAEKSGVSLPQITRYESGKSTPRLSAVMKLAKALNVEIDAFTKTRIEQGLKKVVLTGSESGQEDIHIVVPSELMDRIYDAAEESGMPLDDAFNFILGNMIKRDAIAAGKEWTDEDEESTFGWLRKKPKTEP
ncbi:helix-turn-helix domain-containing protein [Metapseudomonas lalkuanensis]|uniref:Helix-turn-helix domain-containing protein n=1 Tax=Metapseudomonas lalkuanensis TaxID=2604832 RepID=A0A5J6QLM7_9GAMM|nr:transcriptional regulator [Pseudomonas lalkuanensis]QEY62542.1 helix-turn-helix domain-containing protein [Pseudomonas lalkuanensis]